MHDRVETPERQDHADITSKGLLCGVLLCPWFYAIVIAQMTMRAGFDITRYPLSLLSLGEEGWIQVVNFITTGLLAIACAAGMRRAMRRCTGHAWGPALIATFGVGMILAGLFRPDPLPGFPPGALVTTDGALSWNAIGHGVGFFVAFTSLIAACAVFGIYFVRSENGLLASYSIVTAVVTLGLITLRMADQRATGVALFSVGIAAFGWVSVVSHRLRSHPRRR